MVLNSSNPTLVRRCHNTLSTLFFHHQQTYLNLFFFEKDIPISDIDMKPLVQAGILRTIGKSYRALVQVIPLAGRFICTDFFYSLHRRRGRTFFTQRNGVWTILPEETPNIAL